MILNHPDRKSRFLGSGTSTLVQFFPPRTVAMEETLWRSIRRLEPLDPTFISVTYGAGGSTRERTDATIARVLRQTKLKPAAHLTCVDATREEVDVVIKDYWDIGVRHIVALRGDPARGVGARYEPTPGGYINAADLTRGIKKIAPFEVSVACYPEKHPEIGNRRRGYHTRRGRRSMPAPPAPSASSFSITRRSSAFSTASAPAVSPSRSCPQQSPRSTVSKQVAGLPRKSGTSVPDWLGHRFEGLEEDQETRYLVAAAVAAEQVMGLVDQGITEFHFYTLNRADLVYAIRDRPWASPGYNSTEGEGLPMTREQRIAA